MKWSYCFLSDVNDSDLQNIYDNLDPSRKQYIDAKGVEKSRRQSLAGEWLAKKLIAEQFGLKNAVICRDISGKPYVKDSDIFISITHSDNLIAVAADKAAVGIDAEKIKPNSLKLIDRICLPDEKDYINADKARSLYRFYEIWTAKEACFKKQGSGITDFKSVNILSIDRKAFEIDDYLIQII